MNKIFSCGNHDRRTTNRALSYPQAQRVSMKVMLSKYDNDTAPAAASLKIESPVLRCNTRISLILHTDSQNSDLSWFFFNIFL